MRQVLALCAFHFFTLPKCNMEPQHVQITYESYLPDHFLFRVPCEISMVYCCPSSGRSLMVTH